MNKIEKERENMKTLSLSHKIILGCSLPIMTTIIVSLFAFMGFSRVEQANMLVKEKIVQSQNLEESARLIEMLEVTQKQVAMFKIQVIIVTIISIILVIVTSFLIARSVGMLSDDSIKQTDAKK